VVVTYPSAAQATVEPQASETAAGARMWFCLLVLCGRLCERRPLAKLEPFVVKKPLAPAC
jgi:hypothetical protein